MMRAKNPIDFRKLYDQFNSPATPIDCGKICSQFNITGKPFCCDICRAVPVAYRQEWIYLKNATTLWQPWRSDECGQEPTDKEELQKITPGHLVLLACKGPDHCERGYRATSCRQFPFFPYITSDFRFIGIAYDWDFVESCWILSNLKLVSMEFRLEFVKAYDQIFSVWLEDLDSYAALSEEMRDHYALLSKRFPLLHRNGNSYLISPKTEKMRRVSLDSLPKFGHYKDSTVDVPCTDVFAGSTQTGNNG